jgi:hypothetical protein
MKTIKDDIPTIAMLSALALILIALVTLSLCGIKSDGPLLIGLGNAAIGMAGAIGGFSMSPTRAPSQISNSPGAQVNQSNTEEKS